MEKELNDNNLEQVAGGVSESDFPVQPGDYFCDISKASEIDPSPVYHGKYFVFENGTMYLKADYFYLNPSRGPYYYYGGFYELFTKDAQVAKAHFSGAHKF